MLYSNYMDVADLCLCEQIQVFLTEWTCQLDLCFVMCVFSCLRLRQKKKLQRQQAFCFWTKTLTIDLYVFTAAFCWEEIIISFHIWDISECHIIAIMKPRPAVNYVTHKNTEVFFYWLTVAMCSSPEYLSLMLQKHTSSFIKYPSHYLSRYPFGDKLLLLVAEYQLLPPPPEGISGPVHSHMGISANKDIKQWHQLRIYVSVSFNSGQLSLTSALTWGSGSVLSVMSAVKYISLPALVCVQHYSKSTSDNRDHVRGSLPQSGW